MIEAPSETGVEDWPVTLNVPFSANWLRAGSVVPAYKLTPGRSFSANPCERWSSRYVSGVPSDLEGMIAVAVIGGGSWWAPAS